MNTSIGGAARQVDACQMRNPCANENPETVWDAARETGGHLPRYSYDLLALCLNLHCALSGVGDPLDDKDEAVYVATIYERLANWTKSGAPWLAFDEAVRGMCCAVLAEYHDRLLERAEHHAKQNGSGI